jgi:hypothetical protein
MLTREILSAYVCAAAKEEQIATSSLQAKDLEEKVRAWDQATFERVLRKRLESLRALASERKEGIFTTEFYASQANTVEEIIKGLPQLLAP